MSLISLISAHANRKPLQSSRSVHAEEIFAGKRVLHWTRPPIKWHRLWIGIWKSRVLDWRVMRIASSSAQIPEHPSPDKLLSTGDWWYEKALWDGDATDGFSHVLGRGKIEAELPTIALHLYSGSIFWRIFRINGYARSGYSGGRGASIINVSQYETIQRKNGPTVREKPGLNKATNLIHYTSMVSCRDFS